MLRELEVTVLSRLYLDLGRGFYNTTLIRTSKYMISDTNTSVTTSERQIAKLYQKQSLGSFEIRAGVLIWTKTRYPEWKCTRRDLQWTTAKPNMCWKISTFGKELGIIANRTYCVPYVCASLKKFNSEIILENIKFRFLSTNSCAVRTVQFLSVPYNSPLL